MPEPMTAPMPSAVRLHGPSVLRSRLLRLFRSGDQRVDAAGAEEPCPSGESALNQRLRWPCVDLSIFFFIRAAGHARGALRLRGRFLARRALQLLAFFRFLYGLCIHLVVCSGFLQSCVFLH